MEFSVGQKTRDKCPRTRRVHHKDIDKAETGPVTGIWVPGSRRMGSQGDVSLDQ